MDGDRRLGNGFLLPAGPLREPKSRLDRVDLVVVNGQGREDEFSMKLFQPLLHSLAGDSKMDISELAGRAVHAIAGIGNPQRFFQLLTRHGIEVEPHPFPDHHPFDAQDLEFDDDLPILMTEKDAVKCRRFASPLMWYVPVEAALPEHLALRLLQKIKKLTA